MQRDPSLRNLSSEHHSGLVIARKARKAVDQEAAAQAAAWESIQQIFRSELEPHFQTEERALLPALRETGEEALVERTLQEHRAMRALIADNNPANLMPFAEALKAHIRFEENELFEIAQKMLGPERLAELADNDKEGS